jgi:2-methylisocitrate lyase-like PEP mutase family enzyme
MSKYIKFKALHTQTKPLIIGNVWNVQSAKVYKKLNFKAIGTSSAAIAHSLGYDDGEQMPFSDLLFMVEKISKISIFHFRWILSLFMVILLQKLQTTSLH